jgi:acid stress-induced BolA-like protein IbaG/YrbA
MRAKIFQKSKRRKSSAGAISLVAGIVLLFLSSTRCYALQARFGLPSHSALKRRRTFGVRSELVDRRSSNLFLVAPCHLCALPVYASVRGGGQSHPSERHASNAQAIITPAVQPWSSWTTLASVLAARYRSLLESYPIQAKAVTSGLVYAVAAYLAHCLEQRTTPKAMDPVSMSRSRLYSNALVGLMEGPLLHFWVEFVFWLFPGRSFIPTVKKAVVSQLVYEPLFTSLFFAIHLVQLQAFTVANWWDKVRRDSFTAFLAGAGFWPFVDLLGYSAVPPMWIPFYMNVCTLFFTIYMSILSNK